MLVSMIEILASTGGMTGVAAVMAWWLWHDGPARLIAGMAAVLHPDARRRADAREVLRSTIPNRPQHRQGGGLGARLEDDTTT